MAAFTSMEHLRFLLTDVHSLASVLAYDKFKHLDTEQCWMMLEAAKLFAEMEMYPWFREMDETPAKYDGKGGVITHPQLKIIFQKAAEQGWIGGNASFEQGGLQLPEMIFSTGHHLFQAANNGVQGYLGLSGGAAALITHFGNEEQIAAFVPPIFEGRWQGTMALTEPQAGSSLSDILTTAKATGDGHFSIKGQKIFISGGQHDACDNFVHLTLARIEGAPAGVKGISLFIIPKFRVEKDGSLVYNDVFCAGDYQKMGQKGYSTTHLSFGDLDDCRGYLLGEPHKGLGYMFLMMNGARISVGQCAASVAMAAYQASLQYAQERPQGRLPGEKDPMQPPVLIIQHADVQRMLLTQKAIVEGALSLGMECNRLADMVNAAKGSQKEEAYLLLEILTPIMKTYASEQGSRSASMAIQVLGGYGYTTDFPVQQYYRDLRIMSLYEGTTGIQSLDLLGRKVIMENGKAFALLVANMQNTIQQSQAFASLVPYARLLEDKISLLQKALNHLLEYAKIGEMKLYLADASVFMELSGYIVIGWQWLKQGLSSVKKLAAKDFQSQTEAFYTSKLHTMEFFFIYELPHADACKETLMNKKQLTLVKQPGTFNW